MQKEEEKKFKEVGEAFTVLSDPKKKMRYDSGHDLEEENSFDGGGRVLACSSSAVVLFVPMHNKLNCYLINNLVNCKQGVR